MNSLTMLEPDEFARIIQSIVIIQAVQDAAAIPRLTRLTFGDILQLRQSALFAEYHATLRSYLRQAAAFDFVGGPVSLDDVAVCYNALIREIARTKSERDVTHYSNIGLRIESPGVSFDIDFKTTKIKLDGGRALGFLAARGAPLVVKLVIGARDFASQTLGTAYEVSRRKLTDPAEQWSELVAKISERTRFQVLTPVTADVNEAASERSEDLAAE